MDSEKREAQRSTEKRREALLGMLGCWDAEMLGGKDSQRRILRMGSIEIEKSVGSILAQHCGERINQFGQNRNLQTVGH